MRHAKVMEVEIPPGHRILAVSDIHANSIFLRKLLKKAKFGPEDYLFLLGDIVEKGRDSLATLRLVMELSSNYPYIYALCGNCDDIALTFIDEFETADLDFYEHYFHMYREDRNLLMQMAREAGITVNGQADYPAVRSALQERFVPELEFLRSLPNIILTPDYLFVHGGVPREENLEELDAWRCMKNDDFISQGHTFRRWCVVGHWPVTLYNPKIPCARPLIEPLRHIISIDGGCSLKLDGQLNALIIPTAGSEDFSYVSYDGFPYAKALDSQAASTDSINIRWGKNVVQVLEHGQELSRCRHMETGRELDILTHYLYQDGADIRCEDATDYCLPVSPGDLLSVVRRTAHGTLVKRDGVTGWYYGRLEMMDGGAETC